MSAIGNITINDGAASPVAHVFSPVNIDKDGIAWWADRSGGIPLGYPLISALIKQPSGNNLVSLSNRVYRELVKIKVPVLEVTSPSTGSGINPAPTLSYSVDANLEMVFPERSSLQNRKDLRAFLRNLLADAMIQKMVEDLESPY